MKGGGGGRRQEAGGGTYTRNREREERCSSWEIFMMIWDESDLNVDPDGF